jgi:hypothetical protein
MTSAGDDDCRRYTATLAAMRVRVTGGMGSYVEAGVQGRKGTFGAAGRSEWGSRKATSLRRAPVSL